MYFDQGLRDATILKRNLWASNAPTLRCSVSGVAKAAALLQAPQTPHFRQLASTSPNIGSALDTLHFSKTIYVEAGVIEVQDNQARYSKGPNVRHRETNGSSKSGNPYLRLGAPLLPLSSRRSFDMPSRSGMPLMLVLDDR